MGLISKDPKHFEIEDPPFQKKMMIIKMDPIQTGYYDFTSFTDTKLNRRTCFEQLDKEFKKMLYSHRKSAKEFYSVQEQG